MVTRQALLSRAAASYSLHVQRSTDPWQSGPHSSAAWLMGCEGNCGKLLLAKWVLRQVENGSLIVTHMCNFTRLFNFSFVFAVILPWDVLFYHAWEAAEVQSVLFPYTFDVLLEATSTMTYLFSFLTSIYLILKENLKETHLVSWIRNLWIFDRKVSYYQYYWESFCFVLCWKTYTQIFLRKSRHVCHPQGCWIGIWLYQLPPGSAPSLCSTHWYSLQQL